MPVEYLKETPSQTAGPFLHIGMLPAQAGLRTRSQEKMNVMVSGDVEGERIRVEGIVYDGSGAMVRDAQVEIWQANAKGVYNAPGFLGFGRAGADFKTGEWFIETIKPGRTPGRKGKLQAPHLTIYVYARGINIHLHTRMYFEDEAEANAADPVLNAIELKHTVATLIAKRSKRGGETVYRFDIHLQGEKETVFFDI
ncbi:MAG TPA: protocatechuate 3,4-dioxygenase subunit alpha [Beijerinckiaceae bacterium]|nr:protocatechuate 3,4-dioxygenase subunit alpha [Beijerinckiaceae bacterium]